MAPVLTTRELFRSRSVSIAEISCRHPKGGEGHEEETPGLTVAFPRSGVYRRHGRSGCDLVDPNHAVLFRAGEVCRFSHPTDGGDESTAFTFADEAGFETSHFPVPVVPAGAAAVALVHRLRRICREPAARAIEIDECALSLLAAAVASAQRAAMGPPRPSDRRRRRVDAVRELLASRFRDRLTLDGIAYAAGCSPFHLVREFRAETGLPVHRYLTRLRLRAAMDRVAGGADDLTLLALDLGFSSHAHLTDTFRREFGVPPSRVRAAAPKAELDLMRKKLEA
jgi:AraC family transcriptional regulator